MYYRRHLPHWQRDRTPLFVTWRLFSSLPTALLKSRQRELNPGKAFMMIDRELDKAAYGPTWLREARVAKVIVDALEFGEQTQKMYRLHSFVVMSNHVHMLIRPFIELPRITKVIKGFTAREANKILRRTGQRFWQDESFDHWVRNEDEFYRIVRYIENNPVRAGLVSRPEDWQWSSAWRRRTDIPVCLGSNLP
jgi:REP element-mobilizing transposase RayT